MYSSIFTSCKAGNKTYFKTTPWHRPALHLAIFSLTCSKVGIAQFSHRRHWREEQVQMLFAKRTSSDWRRRTCWLLDLFCPRLPAKTNSFWLFHIVNCRWSMQGWMVLVADSSLLAWLLHSLMSKSEVLPTKKKGPVASKGKNRGKKGILAAIIWTENTERRVTNIFAKSKLYSIFWCWLIQ